MARGDGMTRRGPVDANEFHEKRKADLVASGGHVWMIHARTGGTAAVLNNPEAIARKKKQGYLEAEVVEEVVKRPVVKATEGEAPAAPQAPKRGPGRPRKVQTEDGE